MKNMLVLNIGEGLQNYLTCKVRFSRDKKRAWSIQLHLIESLEKNFDNQVKKLQSHKTPGMPKCFIVRPMIDSEKISAEDQNEYQPRVGMLLFLVKHSRPDIANATRNLSKSNDGVNSAAF